MSSYKARVAERNAAIAEAARVKQQLRSANEDREKDAMQIETMKERLEQLSKIIKETRQEPDEQGLAAAALKLPNWNPPDGYLRAKDLIYYDPGTKLGDGSSGTVVYRGYFGIGNRDCAIKRMSKGCSHDAKKEIEALLKIDDHPNIVKYYHMEENVDFIFIALELCAGNLDTLVKLGHLTLSDKFSIVQQALNGLEHLHNLHITHRDIKPANVLYIPGRDGVGFTIKLADLGFARQLESSTQGASVVARSQGWQPPEVLDFFDAAMQGYAAEPVLPKPADAFSMGLLIFSLFSTGHVHPFGGGIKVEPNIMSNNRVNIGKNLVPAEVEDLVVRMITHIPEHRLRISDCLLHPALWSPERQLEFLKITSDALQHLLKVNGGADFIFDFRSSVTCHNWKKLVDVRLLMRGNRSDMYGDTADELLRLLRNKEHHFDELPPDLKSAMGNTKLGVLSYFLDPNRFPLLLVDSFRVVAKWYCVPSPADIGDTRNFKVPVLKSNATINIPAVTDYLGNFTIHFIHLCRSALP